MEHANKKYRYAIKLLHELYIYLNESFFESALSSEPVITIQFDPTDNILGWFKPKEVWVEGDGSHGSTEMNITAQYLNRPIEDIACTMLHEMCHQMAYEMGIKDTSRHGYYHNHNFKTIAEAHGLIVKRVPQYGWTDTYLKQSTYRLIKERYPDKVSLIFHKTQLELYIDWLKEQGVEPSDETSAKTSRKDLLGNLLSKSTSTRKYSCPRCGNSVRATKEVYIICGDCNAKMTLAPKKKNPAKG